MGAADFTTNEPVSRSRRSSGSEKIKELEEINGIVSGKNILITGGVAGLGQAFVNHFLQHGVNKIAVLDVDKVSGMKMASAMDKSHGTKKLIFIHADVSKHEENIDAFKAANAAMGSIDIVINNAGILDERRWEKEIAVNITGMMSIATLAVEYMSKEKGARGGILVNIAQNIDFRWTAQLPVYTATKYAIVGLSQSLAVKYDLNKTGIRILTLSPGLTETTLTIDSPNKLLSRVMKADFVKNLEQLPIQTPFIVAQGLMTILRFGETGSIWVIENGSSPHEVLVPYYRDLRRLYKNNFTVVDTVKVTKGRPIREVCDNTRTGLMSCA